VSRSRKPRRANGARESATKASEAAPEARQGESAAEKRKRELAIIEAEVAKRGIKAKPLIVAPLPVVLTQSEKAKRAVLHALGHDADGKCPTGVDRQNNLLIMMRDGAPEEFQCATLIAQTRARCFSPLIHMMRSNRIRSDNGRQTGWLDPVLDERFSILKALPACGWKWCKDKGTLPKERWADLFSAVKDLKAHGLDPNGYKVACYAAEYAILRQQAEAWPLYRDLAAVIDNTPGAERHFSPELRQSVSIVQWVRAPRKGGGQPVNKPMQLFLNKIGVAGHAAAVAAAILFLFGFAEEGKRYGGRHGFKHSIEVAWTRGGDLNIRQDKTDDEAVKAKRNEAREAWRALGDNRALEEDLKRRK
jgi:hypothetical protein